MKKQYYSMGLIILIILNFLVNSEITKAQPTDTSVKYKKYFDRSISLGWLDIATIKDSIFVTASIEVPPGTALGGVVRIDLFSSSANDSIYPVGSPIITGLQSQNAIYVEAVSNNNFVIAYQSDPLLLGGGDVSVALFDANATMIWNASVISGVDFDRPYDIKVSGSDIYICGTSYSHSWGDNAFLVKMDISGNILWTKYLEGHSAVSIAPIPTGEVAVLSVEITNASKLYYLDSSGNILWRQALNNKFVSPRVLYKSSCNKLLLSFMNVNNYKTNFRFCDLNGVLSARVQLAYKDQIYEMKESHAGFVAYGAVNGVNSGTTFMAEFDDSFNFIWIKKDYKDVSIGESAKTFLGMTQKDNGWVGAANVSRSLGVFPPVGGSTYDLMLETVKYPFPSNTLSLSGSTVVCPGQSLEISVPHDPNNTYDWKKYGNIISGETSNSLTVTGAGKYKVVITNRYGMIRTSALTTVTFDPVCPLAEEGNIFRLTESKKLNVFPNPSVDDLTIDSGLQSGELQIIDMSGRLVLRQEVLEFPVKLIVSDLKPGMYIVTVGTEQFRFAKQ